MPLKLLTGPIGSGKTSAVLQRFRATLPAQSGLLVVPARQAAAELRRSLIEGDGVGALPRDAILDWGFFARLIADPASPLVGPLQSTLLVSRLFAKARLSYFRARTTSLGLAGQFASSISMMKRNGVRSTDLKAMVARRGASARREGDLAEVYALYEREIERLGLVDEAGLAVLAIARAGRSDAPPLAGISSLFVDEFQRFAPGEIELLRAIRDAYPRLDITVTLPSPEPSSARGGLFAASLEEGRARLAAIVDEEERLTAKERVEPRPRVVCTRSPAQEARFVAKLTADLSAGGLSPADIVVAAEPGGSFIDWLVSEAGSMGVLPEHAGIEGAGASSFIHEFLSPKSLERLPERGSAAVFTSCARRIALGADTASEWSRALSRHPAVRSAIARNASAAEALAESLASIETSAALVELDEIGRDDFVRILKEALPGGGGPSSDESLFPFRLASPNSPLATPAKAIVVPRMVEGAIPRTYADPPFFSGWDEPELGGIVFSSSDAYASAAYAFETMVAKCRETIAFVYSAVDEGGGETQRSAFLDNFLSPQDAPEYAPPILPAPAAAGAIGWEGRLASSLEVEGARNRGERPAAGFGGELSSAEALSLVRKRYTENDVRVTALQKYAECPFVFFVENVLKSKELPEDTPELAPSVRGNVIHRILKRFYEEHSGEAIEARSSPSKEKGLAALVRKIAREVWEEHREEVERISPGLKERGLRAIEMMVMQVVEAEIDEARRLPSPLAPRECEWPFGREEGRPLCIPLPGDKPASISGRIDRVDAGEGESSFLVIDYKTGASGPVIGDMKKGLHLQLPLYVDAAARLLFPKARALGGLIVDVKSARAGEEKETAGKCHGFVRKSGAKESYRIGRRHSALSDDEFEEAIESARRTAARCIEEIRAGKFGPSPNESCRSCRHGDICRQKHVASD